MNYVGATIYIYTCNQFNTDSGWFWVPQLYTISITDRLVMKDEWIICLIWCVCDAIICAEDQLLMEVSDQGNQMFVIFIYIYFLGSAIERDDWCDADGNLSRVSTSSAAIWSMACLTDIWPWIFVIFFWSQTYTVHWHRSHLPWYGETSSICVFCLSHIGES